ncbi:MAG: TonB-dependent receptor plug, partial [Candidatus Solibacter sp.]|nr:TonB-dependent receptor plug [Candidatus Solibacter sp.]
MKKSKVVLILVLFGCCGSALSQMTGGRISGRVTDASGAVIPGTTVTIENQTTGQRRTLNTNEKGFYSVPSLSPGLYNVTSAHTGFGDLVKMNLLVDVGQELVVDFQLTVGTLENSVDVTADAQGVGLASSSLSNVVDGQTVRGLPLNGRDWTLLAALEPGVHTIEAQTAIAAGNNGREDRGWGTQMTVGGSRPQQNSYRLDGVNINDFAGGGPGNVLGSAIGTDAIQEFSVVAGNASADYGLTSGGVINAVTRSGSNGFHASAYEFLRNSAMDSRNFFDGSRAPPFKRNQFGGTIGGPIRKNKTFFFFNYEGLRQDLSSTTVTTVPSADARTGQLVSGKVTVDPKVAPFLNIFPRSNGPVSGDAGVYSFVSAAATPVDLYTGRIDHKYSDSDTMHGTFLVMNSTTTSPDATDFVITGATSQSRMGSVEETHVFRPDIVNIARAGLSRSDSAAPTQPAAINPLAADTSLGFLPGTPVGGISITGFTSVVGGVGSAGENIFHYTGWQFYDDVYYTHNVHSLEFGVAIERIDSNESGKANPNGVYTFGSLQAFLTNQPQRFSATIPGKSPTIYLRQSVSAFYARDDYRVRPNLTLNLGVRYEMATVPTEKYNRLSNLDSLTAATPKLGSPYFHNPTLRNFSPRVG